VIIKATRITTASGPGHVGAHVFDGPGNEDVLEIRGCREDLDDMVADAVRHGARYSIRHVTISPAQATTRKEALALVERYALEFGADAGRTVVVEHRKPREGGAGFETHWHAMLPEVRDGRVLDSSWMRARHEKLSRVAEMALGHALVPGRWNRAVEAALRAEGHREMAEQVAPLALMARPTSSYTGTQHQAARRAGLSMPHTKATAMAAAKATWEAADGGRAFAAAMAGQGLRLKAGDKPGIILIEGVGSDGDWHELGALHRMLKADRQAVADRLSSIDFGLVFDAAHDCAAAPAPQPAPITAAVPAAEPAEEKHHADDSTRADAVVVGRRQADSGRGCRGRPDSGAPAHGRQEGPVSDGVRRAPGRSDDRQPDPAPGLAGPAHGAGGIEHRLGPDAAGARGREPDTHRAAAGRHRVQARRAALGIAAAADGERAARLRALSARLARPDLTHRWIRLCPLPEPADRREAKRRAWVAAALRGAYGTGWLPPSVAARIVDVQVADDGRAVIITLRGGTRIMDRPTRIDVVGTTDDVAIGELVSAVVRRGWDAVEVHGSHDFRRAVSLRLALLDPPVLVADTPLTEADQAAIERARQAKPVSPVLEREQHRRG
jgi:hypothetical protein